MAYVIAAPEMMTAAATDLANIASNVSAAHLAAAAPTVAVIPAAADEVSAGIAHVFSQHAQGYQALAGKAAAFHDQFVATLHASAGSFAATEAASAATLRPAAAGLSLNSLLDSVRPLWAALPPSVRGPLSIVGQFFVSLLFITVILFAIGIFLAYLALLNLLSGGGIASTA
jgi:PE family protein